MLLFFLFLNYSSYMQEDLTIIIGAGPSGLAAAKYAK